MKHVLWFADITLHEDGHISVDRGLYDSDSKEQETISITIFHPTKTVKDYIRKNGQYFDFGYAQLYAIEMTRYIERK